MIRAGFNGGDWLGTGGIVSTAAQATAGLYTLGVADNASLELSSFGGHAGLGGAEVLVKYTIVGDANLDGLVNGIDFLRLTSGFDNVNPDAWTYGDFNYSGVVDAADFYLYLSGFHNQPGGVLWPDQLYGDMMTFAVQNGLDTSLIPEPSCLALLAATGCALTRRARRATPEHLTARA